MKRIISVIITAVMILSNFNVFASDGFDEQYYKEAISLMEALDIRDGLTEGTLTDMGISRIEFLKAVVRMITKNTTLNLDTEDMRYTDVNADAWVVCYAIQNGMISDGYKFYPDDDADLSFAASVVTAAAGYEIKNGSQAQIVNKAGLTKKLRADSKTDFSLGDAYVLIYNLLLSKRYESTNGKKYELTDNSFLKEIYDVEIIKGRMVADSESSFYGESVSENIVKIKTAKAEYELYYEGNTKELLGRNVKVYYSEDEAVLILPESDEDILLSLDAKSFLNFDSGKRRLYYNVYEATNRWENSVKVKDEYIPQNADIIYNGRFTANHSFAYGILEGNGEYNVDSLVLIDADDNGKPDLIRFDAYKTAFVSKPNEEKLTVKDNFSKNIIDFDMNNDGTEVVVCNEAGNEISFKAIPDNSVISIFENTDEPKKTKIVVSERVVSGLVSQIFDEDVTAYLIADGEEFRISETFAPHKAEISMGVTYTLYLDHNLNVAGYKLGADSLQSLGGVVKITISEKDENVLVFTVYTVEGKTLEIETAEKWKVNGSSVYFTNSGRPMYNEEDGTITDVIERLRAEFIQYKLNAFGKIREIRTAKNNAEPEELGYTSGMNFGREAFNEPSKYELIYKTNSKMFLPYTNNTSTPNFAAVGPDTKIIKMPSSNITRSREKYFATGISLKNDERHPVIAYTLSGSNKHVADVIVLVNDSAAEPSDSQYYIVKDISTAINNDETVGYKLTIYDQAGVESEVTTETLAFPEHGTGNNLYLEPGDIINYGVNSLGDASSFVMVYDASEKSITTVNQSSWYVSKRVVSGALYSTEGNTFTYVLQNEITEPFSGNLLMGFANSALIVDFKEHKDNAVKPGMVTDMISYLENPAEYVNIVYISGWGETRMLVAYMK